MDAASLLTDIRRGVILSIPLMNSDEPSRIRNDDHSPLGLDAGNRLTGTTNPDGKLAPTRVKLLVAPGVEAK